MKFKDIFNRRAPSSETEPERDAERAPVRGTRNPAPPAPRAGVPPEDKPPVSLDDALRQLKTIRELLGTDEDDVLNVPCQALLLNLPEHLRGEKWQGSSLPDMKLELPRDATLQQLRQGRISYPLADFLPLLPAGWVQEDPAALVEFDLATVVEAIPPAWFRTTAAASKQVEAARHIPDYFKPAQPAAAATTPAVAVPPAAMPAAATPVVPPEPRPLRSGEWSGVEPALEIGVRSVDINRATEADLMRLPNIGPLRAQTLLRYRQAHGPFASIFDLAAVPGIGRKLFKQVTGLTYRRKDRQVVLNNLLGLPDGARPTLPELTAHIQTALAAAGCVISTEDGIALTASGLPDEVTARYAALVPQLFRRARRYLTKLDPASQSCLALPSAEVPLLCYPTGNAFLIVALPAGSGLDAAIAKGRDIAREINWLLGCRAVVRA